MAKGKEPPKEFIDLLAALYERWQDEKDYEDPRDYLKAIQQVMPTATKLTKNPFGVIYENGKTVFYAGVKETADGKLQIIISPIAVKK